MKLLFILLLMLSACESNENIRNDQNGEEKTDTIKHDIDEWEPGENEEVTPKG